MLLWICKGSVNLSLTPGLVFSNKEPDSSYQSPAINVTATGQTTDILSRHSHFAYEHLLTNMILQRCLSSIVVRKEKHRAFESSHSCSQHLRSYHSPSAEGWRVRAHARCETCPWKFITGMLIFSKAQKRYRYSVQRQRGG